MKVAVIFDNFGPYHLARLNAAARCCEVLGIEVAQESADYLWQASVQTPGFQRRVMIEQGTRANGGARFWHQRLSAILGEFQPSVVAVPGWSFRESLLALRWCSQHGVPVVLMSESQEVDERRGPVKEWLKRRIVRLCQAALVGGRTHQQYLEQLGLPSERIFLGYDAVDNDHFARGAAAARAAAEELRQHLRLPARYFLASSRFIPKKNLPLLLRAFAGYRQQAGSEAWELVILGDGAGRAALEQMVDDLGITSHVRLPGFKQYVDLPSYYGLAGAFVHVSTTEQWGLVVNEAMASGLPVLVSNRCGCVCELVRDGQNGFLLDPTDEAQVVRCLLRVAGDPQLRLSMGEVSRQRIGDWGPDRFANGLEQAAAGAQCAPLPPRSWANDWLLRILAAR